MTKDEFEEEYKKLAEAYPEFYGKMLRKELVAACVKDLDRGWFRTLVNRIIFMQFSKVDISEAARSERINRDSIKRSREETEAYKMLESKMTDEGFFKALEKFEAKNLFEAIKNYKKPEVIKK